MADEVRGAIEVLGQFEGGTLKKAILADDHSLLPAGPYNFVNWIRDQPATSERGKQTAEPISKAVFLLRHLNSPGVTASIKEWYRYDCRRQVEGRAYVHKGLPLFWLSDAYKKVGMPWHAHRQMLMAFIEDCYFDQQFCRKRGAWSRLLHDFGTGESELININELAQAWKKERGPELHWAEPFLSQNANRWKSVLPTINELNEYFLSGPVVSAMLKDAQEDPNGKYWNQVAAVVCSAIPGVTCLYINKRSNSVEYDLVLSMDGVLADFRSEWGRYIICESKNYTKKKADVNTVAALAMRIESTRTTAGLLFSRNGLSGQSSKKDGHREVLKQVQRSGKCILVIDEKDIKELESGSSFISILRSKRDELFLDLSSESKISKTGLGQAG